MTSITNKESHDNLLVDNFILVVQNKANCIYLQRNLPTLDVNIFEQISEKIAQHFAPLICHRIANYFVGKAVHLMANKQLTNILKSLYKEQINVLISLEAAICLQKITIIIKTNEQKKLIATYLERNFLESCLNKSAVFAVETFIRTIGKPYVEKIFDLIIKHAVFVALQQYSTPVIKAFLVKCSNEEFNSFADRILGNIQMIVFDQFGCFLLKNIFELRSNLVFFFQVMNYLESIIHLMALDKCGAIVITYLISYESERSLNVLRKALMNKEPELLLNSKVSLSVMKEIITRNSKEENQLLLDVAI